MERVLSPRTVKFCSGRPTHQTPRIIAMLSESAGVSASGRAEVGLLSFRVRSSVGRSERARAAQIQMKCLGMRQSITQSTPSPHEVHSLARSERSRERERGKEGAIPELEVARARGRAERSQERSTERRSGSFQGESPKLDCTHPSANSAQLVNSFDGGFGGNFEG